MRFSGAIILRKGLHGRPRISSVSSIQSPPPPTHTHSDACVPSSVTHPLCSESQDEISFKGVNSCNIVLIIIVTMS
jgi:hypothetical protein